MASAKKDFIFVHDPDENIVDVSKVDYYDKEYGAKTSNVPSRWLQTKLKDPTRPAKGWNLEVIWVEDPDIPNRRTPLMLPGYTWSVGTRKERDEWMENRPDPGYTDIVGRPVKRGTRVAVAFALGRGAEIRVGHVVGYDQLLSGTGGYNVGSHDEISSREQIVVEWEKDNRWGTGEGFKDQKTKIFASLRRYVVIE